MPLSTITFDKLRESNERGLTKAEFQPGIAAEQDTEREAIGALLDDRAHIESLASTQEQRESYGVEKFHSNFVMLRTCLPDENCTYEGEEYRNFIWSRVPDSPFKRFQELFSRTYQFVVPRFEIHAKNRVVFPAGTNFDQMSLEACQVSVDKIPDELAQKLGLCCFGNKDSRLERLEKKKAMPIQTLKLIFSSAAPLQEQSQRMLQVQEAQPEMEELFKTTVPPKALGTILYMRENGKGRAPQKKNAPEPPRDLIPQHFASAYRAVRKTAHERASYDTEQLKIVSLKQELAALILRCDRKWKSEKATIIEGAQKLLERGHQELEHCIKHCKVSADLRIVRCGELLMQANVSAAMATMVGALNDLQKRLDPIPNIGGYNEEDRFALQGHITEQEILMKQFRRDVEDAAGVYNGDPAITNATELGIFACDLSRVSLQPLRTYADRISEKLVLLDRALLTNNQTTAKQSLIQMHVIGKFQAARTCFEHIKLWIAEDCHVSLNEVRRFVDRLNTIFAKREVYPDITVEGYEEIFNDMQKKILGIAQRLTRYAASPMSADEHKAMAQWLREDLKTIDIENIVKELP